jgi:hypothetical protein
LRFLEDKSEDINPLLEGTALPEELLRDPSYWMNSNDVEDFLSRAISLYSSENLLTEIGHSTAKIRSWGVLDSVLRMMPRPQEIFNQPEKFLSYFISPAPPVGAVVRAENSVKFDVPVSADLYPLTTNYLRAAFESLPVFVGQSLAQCSWSGITLEFSWSAPEANLFGEDLGHQISPELLQSIVVSLEKHQRELEEKNRDLQLRNEQLLKAHAEMEEKLQLHPQALAPVESMSLGAACPLVDNEVAEYLKQEISRLSDYMVRASQLVTLLVAQDRLSPQVKAAMKRVDWDKVQTQYPQVVQHCREVLEASQTAALVPAKLITNSHQEVPRV